MQTPDGYLWIGTRYGGLARFDGMRFTPFNPQNTPALQDVQVERLSVDPEGRLWIMMGNESITTLHDNAFRLRRAPRTTPRMRLDHALLAPRPGEILFAGETGFLATARLASAATADVGGTLDPGLRTPAVQDAGRRISALATDWTIHDPRPEIEIDRRTFCVDRDGVVWALATSGKIVRFQNGRFEPIPASLTPTLPPNATITAIAADNTRTIWASTPKRLLRYDTARGAFIDVTPAVTPAAPAPQSITQIAFSGDNGLWVLERKRLRKLLDGHWVAEITNEQMLQHAAADNTTLHGDAQGNLWVISYGRGLWHAKADNTATLLDARAGLPGVFITCWYQDTEGNIWVGATGGIARIRESAFTTYGPAQGLPGEAVSSVCVDARGKLWAGTMTGNLASWEHDHFEQHPLPNPDKGTPLAGLTVWPAAAAASGLMKNEECRMKNDQTDASTPANATTGAAAPHSTFSIPHSTLGGSAAAGIWIGSVNHGLMRLLDDGQIHNQKGWQDVRILFGDSRANLWVGPLVGLYSLRDNRITSYGVKKGYENGLASGAVAEDDTGAIWIGTGPGDLWRYKDNTFTKYTPPPEWVPARISALLPDPGGATIWIGTLGGGLLRFHDGAFTRCTTENGLPDNNITQLLDSADGHLWAGTYAGIFRAAKDDLARAAANNNSNNTATTAATVRIYGRYDGLPALECTSGFQPACWRSATGILYFATANGVVSVNPRKITENKIPPPVIIEELIVDGTRTAFGLMKNEECRMKNDQTAASIAGAAAPDSTLEPVPKGRIF